MTGDKERKGTAETIQRADSTWHPEPNASPGLETVSLGEALLGKGG